MTLYRPAVQQATVSVLRQTLSALVGCQRPSLHPDIPRVCRSDDERSASAAPAMISSPAHCRRTHALV